MSLALKYVQTSQWAILEEHLRLIAAIADRDMEQRDTVIDAIERKWGVPLAGTRDASIRGNGVAVVPVAGPMFRYANLITEISGATSYERLARDFSATAEDPDVRKVVLDINSPGGTTDGIFELADLVKSYSGSDVEVVAFVSNLGTSAAYWLASAADRIVVSKTAILGNIGAVLGITDYSGRDEKRGIKRMEFVSSVSPDKRLDPFSEDEGEAKKGKAQLQAIVDRTGEVFVQIVSSYRGMSEEAIVALRGGMFVGEEAVAAGLADEVGTLEGLIQSFTETGTSSTPSMSLAASAGGLDHTTEGSMEEKTKVEVTPVIDLAFLTSNHPDLVESISAGGIEAERQRILAIHDLDAQGFDSLKRKAMEDPMGTPGSTAQAILAAKGEQEQRRAKATQDALDADEQGVAGLTSATLPTEEGETEDALAASVLKWVPEFQAVVKTEKEAETA